MTESEAQEWIGARFGEAAQARLTLLHALVVDEASRQNLVAPSTFSTMWTRHIVDSAQLLSFVDTPGLWIDIGTGAGFPGLVIAILRSHPILLVEPRTRRAEFLATAAAKLEVGTHCDIVSKSILDVDDRASVISARAVASLPRLLELATSCASRDTVWLLPKGRSAREEIAEVERTWHGVFHVEQSQTDPTSFIVIASGVSRR